jgi:ADP-ribosylglycohydrolase
MNMTKDQAKGMLIGLFVGDAMGAPLEFTKPNTGKPVSTMIGGGVHGMAAGECSFDDAVVDAINRGGDADTVGAVTGMICGRMYGYESIKKSSIEILKLEEIIQTFNQIYFQ